MTLSPSSGPNSPDLTQPLTVGNAVNVGFRLYGAKLKPYLWLATRSTLWVLLPIMLAIALGLFYATTQRYFTTLGLVIPAWVVLMVFCSARSYSLSAAIARLGFGDLTQQPESIEAACRYTRARQWQFLWVYVLLFLLGASVSLLFYIVAAVVVVVMLVFVGGTDFLLNPQSAALVNPGLILLAFLVFLGIVGLLIWMLTWFSIRFSVPDLPLAVEPGLKATQSLGRSWELTHKNVGRIFLILLVTWIATIPLQFVIQILLGIAQEAIVRIYPENSPLYGLLTFGSSFLISLLLGIFTLPLWQSIKATIYYDLRRRREGLGLQLSNPELDDGDFGSADIRDSAPPR
ncbi:DUF975 domain-containing protein [Thermoleptolyngbya sichuanensis A183]|uniref:DUF975 domain-containing protein n=1 Tax=Thermoleptolyngbya sichuanensis A183 TaxID=2737172 RepID=A0A6M8BCQ6_9CYAN|nr:MULTISPECIES: DUF975 domain-containing protein [Thermoleptolyngbya]QKD83892.1 DUF975 domain-containing protein [Thermoleptolyngbya sichuanensis A183]